MTLGFWGLEKSRKGKGGNARRRRKEEKLEEREGRKDREVKEGMSFWRKGLSLGFRVFKEKQKGCEKGRTVRRGRET